MSATSTQDAKAQREQRAAELRRIINAPSEKDQAAEELARIEREERAEREEAGRKLAVERSKAISRAIGSVVASLDEDEQRAADAAKAYIDAVTQLNARYRQIETLAAESDAIVDRFGIGGAKVPKTLPPNRRERCIAIARQIAALEYGDYRSLNPITEQCENRMRVRRNYSEVAGTPSYDIINGAGLKPFSPLSEVQLRMVEDRQRGQEQDRQGMKSIAPLARETLAESAIRSGGIR